MASTDTHLGVLCAFDSSVFRCLNPCLCPRESLGTQQLVGWSTSAQLAVTDLLWPQGSCVALRMIFDPVGLCL